MLALQRAYYLTRYDPLVLVHARALLTSTPEGACDYIDADLRETDTILAEAAKTLDFARPVALMMLDKADNAAVLAAVEKAGPDRQDQICQAYFFFAQYHIIHQASPAVVRADLQRAQQTCPSRTVFRKSVEADLVKLGSSK